MGCELRPVRRCDHSVEGVWTGAGVPIDRWFKTLCTRHSWGAPPLVGVRTGLVCVRSIRPA